MLRTRFELIGAGILAALLPASLAHAQTAVTCYFDSVAGDDTKTGLSEDEARQEYTKVPSTCTVAKFKRGSVWNLASGDTLYPLKRTGGTSTGSKVKTLTNYGDASLPLPAFVKQREHNNCGMVNATSGGLTIDGIHMEGAESDAQMANIAQGICIFAGSNMTIVNNDITNCDLGMMLSGTGSLVQGNYVHNLHVVVDAPPGVDPNLVGGAEGIFINGSNNEVSYNSFIDCSDYAEWTGGDCDGGATEVAIGGSGGPSGGGEVTGLKIHHNLAVNTCGFFEVSSMGNLQGVGGGIGTSGSRGTFSDSAFYNNVIIDSGWLSLLQVSNTDLNNIRWENNTFVQHKGSVNSGIIAVVYTACSSGMCGGALQPNTVFWTNNLFVFDGVGKGVPDKNFVQTTNIITTSDPGFVNLKELNDPQAFKLTAAATTAIDQGTALAEVTLDFNNSPVPDPTSGKPDIGAFEYNSTAATTAPPTYPGTIAPSVGNQIGKGGAGGATTPTGTGGAAGATTVPKGTGGAGGTTTAPVGGTGAGGKTGTGGSTIPATTGAGGTAKGSGGAAGAGGTGGSSTATTAAASGGTTSPPKGSGGAGSGGTTTSSPAGSGGIQGSGGTTSAGSTSAQPTGTGGIAGNTGTPAVVSSSSTGCNCQVGHGESPQLLWLSLLGWALLFRRRQRG